MRRMNSAGRAATTALLMFMFLTLSAAGQDWKQAVAYYNQGQFDKALQELKPYLDKNPDWEFGHRLAGLCYLSQKNNALAIGELSRAVQLKSTAYATYQGLAEAYFNSGKLDNCLQSLGQGEQYAKTPADLYNLSHMRGSANYRLEKYNEAVGDLTAAIRIKATNWADFSQLGVAYYNLGRYDESIQALQKALSLNPGNDVSTEMLGKCYFKQGVAALSGKQYQQAVELLQKAANYTPGDGYIQYNMAEAWIFLKKFPEAEKALNQAATLLPQSPEVFQRLGLVCENQKKWDPAIKAYEKANQLNPTPALKEAIERVTELKKQKS